MHSISTSTTSPGRMARVLPGVPVSMISPGASVTQRLTQLTTVGPSKVRSAVDCFYGPRATRAAAEVRSPRQMAREGSGPRRDASRNWSLRANSSKTFLESGVSCHTKATASRIAGARICGSQRTGHAVNQMPARKRQTETRTPPPHVFAPKWQTQAGAAGSRHSQEARIMGHFACLFGPC
jgi:hypothetical protein